MIIYGTQVYGKRDKVDSYGTCDSCGKYAQQKSYSGRQWFHLYFLPLIPCGGRNRVLRECSQCRRGKRLPEQHLPAIIDGLQAEVEAASAAVLSGRDHYEAAGEERMAVPQLVFLVENLFTIASPAMASAVPAQIREGGAGDVADFLDIKLDECRGQTDSLLARYASLLERWPDDSVQYHYATLLFRLGRVEKAAETAEELELRRVDDLSVKQLLINCYEAGKQWDRLVDAYENCFLIVPELLQDKAVVKRYKKACKKAGRQPMKPGDSRLASA